MTFDQAIESCKKGQKIIWGTRTEKFHLIDKNDRDFKTSFATKKTEAKKLGEVKTILKSLGKL